MPPCQIVYNGINRIIINRGDMKPIYLSKINWAMVLLAVIGILQIVQAWYANNDFSVSGIITLAIAILVFVLRTFYTDAPIDTPKARGKQFGERMDDLQ